MSCAEAFFVARAREASAEATFRYELALEEVVGQADAVRAGATRRKALALVALVAARAERQACERALLGAERETPTLLATH